MDRPALDLNAAAHPVPLYEAVALQPHGALWHLCRRRLLPQCDRPSTDPAPDHTVRRPTIPGVASASAGYAPNRPDVRGASRWRMPKRESASNTAFATATGTATVGNSPLSLVSQSQPVCDFTRDDWRHRTEDLLMANCLPNPGMTRFQWVTGGKTCTFVETYTPICNRGVTGNREERLAASAATVGSTDDSDGL